MNRSGIGSAAALLALLALACGAPAYAAQTQRTASVAFEPGKPVPLDVAVGDLRVAEFRVARRDATLIEQVLPPRGGQSRFSWHAFSFGVENTGERSWSLDVRVRLLDENGAVIDEFDLDARVWRGRTKTLEIRRLTLNYVLPLVKRVELTFTAAR